MKSSPTQRSLALLRQTCDAVAVTEKWNPHAGIRQDLFGFIDIIALRGAETIAVQATSGDNVSKRIQKIAESDNLKHVRNAGWKIEVHGWRKVKPRGEKRPRWECRVENIS